MFEQSIERTSPYETYGQAIARPTYPAPAAPQYYEQRAPTVWQTYRSMLAPPSAPTSPMESAVTGLRHNGEAMAMAALLAFAQRQFGTLDVRGKYPVDGILAALLFALSVKDAGKPDGYASDLRALSQSCSSVFVYRKVLGDEGRAAATSTAATGTATAAPIRANSKDPILEAARAAGF